jgi:hypothetical protein
VPALARLGRLLALCLLVAPACTTRLETNTARTATQQLLGTVAIDRALAALEWPALAGRSVSVAVFSTADPLDQSYLRGAAEALLSERGARIVGDAAQADFVLSLLAGALGTDHTETFLGTPGFETLVVTVPEIVLFRSSRQEGFARIAYVWRDAKTGAFLHRSPPAQASTYARSLRVLFVGSYRTDVGRRAAAAPASQPAPAP